MAWVPTYDITPEMKQKIISFLLKNVNENLWMLISLYTPMPRQSAWVIEGGEGREPVVGLALYQEMDHRQFFCFSGRISDETMLLGMQAIHNGYVLISKRSRRQLDRFLDRFTEHSQARVYGYTLPTDPSLRPYLQSIVQDIPFGTELVHNPDDQEIHEFYADTEPFFFDRFLTSHEPYYIVRDRGHIVAAAQIKLQIPELSLAVIGNFLTMSGYKGMGLAKLLASKIITHLSPGYNRILTSVDSENVAAIRLLKRLRFKHVCDSVQIHLTS